MKVDGVVVISKDDLERTFFSDSAGDVLSIFNSVEKYYLSGVELNAHDFRVAGNISTLLPMFYINFDRMIYMHLDHGRFHEDLVYPGWIAKNVDFNFLIPEKEKYWIARGDCWKIRFIQGAV
ncbi:hypothetical protein X12_002815 [Xanthomonas arboricola]|uniref:hypothetical protein n=1 Tax=Xanthomonas arboricola TaxID=56448 RepID=UPI002B2D58D6|nr:hypothetical protein X12_002815 [Xanthomonas arboricola]